MAVARGVQRVAGYPALVAAVIQLACEDARAGDLEAFQWLQGDAGWWVSWLLPQHVDPEAIQARLLERARPTNGIFQQRMELD